jgi:uncharacterized protein YktA (UPF0223 family)
MSIEESKINNMLDTLKSMKEAKNIDEVEKLADKIIYENLEKQSKKDMSAFSFLDSGKIRDEHKIVSQLDDVTRESEAKATEIFDIMNDVSNDLSKIAKSYTDTLLFFQNLEDRITSGVTREKLIEDIQEHKTYLDKMNKIKEHADNILFEGMSLMQYQDINRQRIERVINIIRTLIKYLNTLFEGRKEDIERTSSAKHLAGDEKESSASLESEEDIEALIAQFNKK